MKTTELIKTYLPDFCWQTAFEILTMLEQVNEDVPEASLKAFLSKYAREGKVLERATPPIRQANRQQYAETEYIRNPKWKVAKNEAVS